MSHYFWGPRGPCPCPEKKCVLMKMSSLGEMYHWVPAKCTENHKYFCNKKGKNNSNCGLFISNCLCKYRLYITYFIDVKNMHPISCTVRSTCIIKRPSPILTLS